MFVRPRTFAIAGVAVALAACGGGATIGPLTAVAPSAAPGVGASPSPVASGSPVARPSGSPVPGGAVSPNPSPGASAGPTTACVTQASPPLVPSTADGYTGPSPIKHIVIIIQENRTFDNIYHGFSEPDGRRADYADYGCDHATKVPLQSLMLASVGDPGGGFVDFNQSYDGGKIDGFKDVATREAGSMAPGLNYAFAYTQQSDVQPYWDMATQGALAERFFHGVKAPTWPSHLMFAAGSTTYDGTPNFRAVDNPSITTGWGCEDPNASDSTGALGPADTVVKGPYPCLSGVTTIADLLTNAGRTWRYYSGEIPPPGTSQSANNLTATTPGGNLNAFASYRQIYFGPNWLANDVMPETRVLADAPAGTLADLTYVVPEAYNSDHSNGNTGTGPSWVASVIDAIGRNPEYKSTAIFVTWDDYGGWYDHVPPPQLDRFGLSYRIPLILVSPYAKHGRLIDTQYEPGSVLKFVEETFGLPSLGTTDARANSVRDMFDFTQSPAPLRTIAARHPAAYFLAHPPDPRPVDPDR